MGALLYSFPEVDVPSKTRRTSHHMGLLQAQGDSGQRLEDHRAALPNLDSPAEESGSTLNQDGLFEELFLSVPSHFTWSKPKLGNTPLFRFVIHNHIGINTHMRAS
jgi:nuclear factor of activated T-cells 3